MKPSRKFIIIVVVLMAFSLLLGACTPAPTETPEAAGRAEAEEPAAEATDAPAVAVDEPDLDEAPTADASATAESEAATATAEAEATATAEATEAAPATPEEVPGDIEGFDAAVQAFFDGAKNFNSITPQQLNELIESGNSPHIVDVRTEEDMEASGHFIPGAVNVPLRLLALNVHWLPLDREDPVVVYGDTDTDAAIAALATAALGFPNVQALQGGGLQGWLKAGLPTQRIAPAGPG